MLILLFAIIFIGVGATTLSYAQSFASELGDYCISKCALTTQPGNEAQDPIGCQCKPGPGSTTLPTVVFMVSFLWRVLRALRYHDVGECASVPRGGAVSYTHLTLPTILLV